MQNPQKVQTFAICLSDPSNHHQKRESYAHIRAQFQYWLLMIVLLLWRLRSYRANTSHISRGKYTCKGIYFFKIRERKSKTQYIAASSKNALRHRSIKEHEIHFGIGLKLRGSRASFFGKPRNIQQAFQPAFSVQLADVKRRSLCEARKGTGACPL